MLTLPCRPDLAWYDFQVVLEGVTYTFEFRWNPRESAWYMSIATEDNTPIISSVKVVIGFPLAHRLNGDTRLKGELWAHDTTNLDRNPGEHDLGDRVTLAYLTPEEAAEVRAT